MRLPLSVAAPRMTCYRVPPTAGEVTEWSKVHAC